MTRLSGKTVIEKAPLSGTSIPADFQKPNFDATIRDKGYRIIHSKAYRCPCKSIESTNVTICKNCGGGGWFWANPTLTKMIITAVSSERVLESEGRLDLGSVNVTAYEEDKLSFMDAIVILDATTEHTEVVYPQLTDDGDTLFAFTKYDIIKFDYIGLFEGLGTPIKRLTEITDYTFQDNKIIFNSSYNNLVDPSVTIRYVHAPMYHIIDIQRDSMVSTVNVGNIGEQRIILPIKAAAQRAHLVKQSENFAGNRLFDNSWRPTACEAEDLTAFERKIKYTPTQTIYDILTTTQKNEMVDIIESS